MFLAVVIFFPKARRTLCFRFWIVLKLLITHLRLSCCQAVGTNQGFLASHFWPASEKSEGAWEDGRGPDFRTDDTDWPKGYPMPWCCVEVEGKKGGKGGDIQSDGVCLHHSYDGRCFSRSGWISACLLMGSSERIHCFALLVHSDFLYQ